MIILNIGGPKDSTKIWFELIWEFAKELQDIKSTNKNQQLLSTEETELLRKNL